MKKLAIIAVAIGCGLLVYLVWPKTIDVDPTQYENKQELIWEDVLLHADLAVVGTVDSLAPSQWNVGEDGATLESMHTDATVRPAQAFLTYKPGENQPPSLPEEITVRLDGGKIGWEKQTYRGEAVLEPGEDVLLLLHENGGGSGAVYYTVYGGKWGKLTRQETDGVVSYTNGRDEVAAEGMVETLQQITEDYANSYNGASDYYTAGEIKEMNDALFEAQ
ncbi:MAG TPA: hypothetical protein H9745_01455 [Candidatus Agathobaculum stercoravium]|nr:hypothetical protein [Candidatus Agathobaculum stercoravium]